MWYSITCPSCGTRFPIQGEGDDLTKVPVVPTHGPPDDGSIDCAGGYAEAINVVEIPDPQTRRPRPMI